MFQGGVDTSNRLTSWPVHPGHLKRLVGARTERSTELCLGELAKPAVEQPDGHPIRLERLRIVAGTLLTLSLVAIVLPIAWGERRARLIGALAVCLPAAVYLLFSVALGIRFPAGRLFEGML